MRSKCAKTATVDTSTVAATSATVTSSKPCSSSGSVAIAPIRAHAWPPRFVWPKRSLLGKFTR